MQRFFVIGDIHGCYHTLEHLLLHVLGLKKGDHICFVGDYIDRGPSSKQVIDLILSLPEKGIHCYPLRGNHEQMLIDALDDSQALELWLMNGGISTLNSFQVAHPSEIDQSYLDFLSNLPFALFLEKYLIVHAGLQFDRPESLFSNAAMLWIRNFIPKPELIGNRKLIHGHTPQTRESIEHRFSDPDTQALNIDCGCVYRYKGMGSLCAVELHSWQIYFQNNIDF